MPDPMTALITALGLVFVIEGTLYALFPEAMKSMIRQVLALPNNAVRTAGLIAAVIGVGLVWLVHR